MRRNSLISMLLALVLLTCISEVQAQGPDHMVPITSKDVSKYSQTQGQNHMLSGTSKVDVSKFSQYYSMTQGSTPKNHIVAPKKFNINGKVPSMIYFGYQQQAVPYSQYQTYAAYTGGNSLWIQGATSWTQYAAVPQGSSLSLLAISSTGGNGYLYEIYPDSHSTNNNYNFYPGYNQINFYADAVGQHILLFIIDGQVSNAAVINVVPYTPQSAPQFTPSNTLPYPQGIYLSPGSTPISTTGDSQVTIVSQSKRGYQVFLDGNYIGTEGTGGDPLDGKFSFKVVGNQNHEIRVTDGQFNYQKTMFFDRGGTKIINV